MKKILALLLTIVISLGLLAACANDSDPTKISVGYMSGPTGMGMAKLIHDNGGMEGNEKYSFNKYADTAAAKKDLETGAVNVICLPTNEAANYYTANDNVVVLAINCLNSLYLLTDKNTTDVKSFSDLEGKTIYTCKNGTPRLVLEYIVEEMDMDITVSYTYDGKEIVTPNDLGTLVVAGSLPIAVMPEPIVTSSLLAIKKNANEDIAYTVDIDLADAWAEICDTPVTMGCIVANAEFAENNKEAIDAFLNEYKASIDFVGNIANLEDASAYIVEAGIMAAAPAAKTALSNLGDAISYIDGAEMKSALTAFFDATNTTLPHDDFYYEK